MQQPPSGATARARRLLRVGDWPVARKLILLCVGIAVVLSITLTALGYTQASRGLQEQAEAALLAEGQGVASAVDTWNAHALIDLQGIAGLSSVQRLLAAGPVLARPDDLAAAREGLASFRAVDPDATALALADARGQIVATTDPVNTAGDLTQRPAFREALAGNTFITGVTGRHQPAAATSSGAPVRAPDGQVIGVVLMRSGIDTVQRIAEAARNRIGLGATGVLLDQNGLVIASGLPIPPGRSAPSSRSPTSSRSTRGVRPVGR